MPRQLSSSTIWIKSTASQGCRASSNVSSLLVERHVCWIEAGTLRRREKDRLAAVGLLTFSINVTLDGCVDHRERIADDETHAFFTRLMDEGEAMLWGRVTYEMMESYCRFAFFEVLRPFAGFFVVCQRDVTRNDTRRGGRLRTACETAEESSALKCPRPSLLRIVELDASRFERVSHPCSSYPCSHLDMARVLGISERLQKLRVAANTAAILGRASPLSCDTPRVLLRLLGPLKTFVSEHVLPAITEIVRVRKWSPMSALRVEVLRQRHRPTRHNRMIG
jgi:hypothetical protein